MDFVTQRWEDLLSVNASAMDGCFCKIIREEENLQNKEFMLDGVINLLEDAMDFS